MFKGFPTSGKSSNARELTYILDNTNKKAVWINQDELVDKTSFKKKVIDVQSSNLLSKKI